MPPSPSAAGRGEIPWATIAYVVVFCAMLWLVPVVDQVFGPLAGYGFLCLAVAIGGWRFDRWLGRQYWRGLKDY